MKILNKIFNKSRLPIVLFLIVLINYYPLFMNNFNTTKSVAVTTKQMVIAFVIECVILGLFLIKNFKITKEVIRNIFILLVVTVITLIVQYSNYKSGKLNLMDLENIACITINIAILYIAFLSILRMKQNSIYLFYIGIVLTGIFVCLINVIMYGEYFSMFFETAEKSKFVGIKSVFAHRNQFAFFLYFSIASLTMLFLKSHKIKEKLVLGLIFLFFMFNLILTASRTGLLCTAIFLCLFFITTNKIKIKTKIVLALVVVLFGLLFLGIATYNFPDLSQNLKSTFEDRIIRSNTISNFNKRTDIWNVAFSTLSTPVAILFGIGRFTGIEILNANNFKFTQFHSFYVEALIAGGIMELIYFLYIYINVLRKVLKSNLRTKYKRFYICLYLSFAVYCGFESLSRFSIGCVDTMCLISVITIPLLHANSRVNVIKWKKKKIGVKK